MPNDLTLQNYLEKESKFTNPPAGVPPPPPGLEKLKLVTATCDGK